MKDKTERRLRRLATLKNRHEAATLVPLLRSTREDLGTLHAAQSQRIDALTQRVEQLEQQVQWMLQAAEAKAS